MSLIIIGTVAWLAFGVITTGVMFASFQRRYPTIRAAGFERDRWFCVLYLLMGPCGFAAACTVRFPTFSCGWLWPWSAKARIEAGRQS